MSKHYPFHTDHTRTQAFVRSNYYGCNPYDTLDAVRMRERIYRVTLRAMVLRTTPYSGTLHENMSQLTWTDVRKYSK